MFCDRTGHMAKNCLKSISKVAKGCAAVTITPEAKPKVFLETKKIGHDLCNFTRSGGCVEPACALKEIYLNVFTLLNAKSLMLSTGLVSYNISLFSMLVDSGSSNLFYRYILCQ